MNVRPPASSTGLVADPLDRRPLPRLRRSALWLVPASVFLLQALASVAGGEPHPDSDLSEDRATIVATWQGGELTQQELDSWTAYQPDAADLDRPEAIRQLAVLVSLAERGRRDGLHDSPEFRLRRETARHAALLGLLKEHVQSQVKVSAAEIDALLRDTPDAFHRPRKLKLRNLYLPFHGSDRADVQERMAELRRRLEDGADFGELARAASRSQTAARGGEMGWVDPDELPTDLGEAVAALQPGELSAPLAHGTGMTIFLCEDVREAVRPDAAEQRRRLEARLLRQGRKAAWAETEKALLAGLPTPDIAASDTVLELPPDRLTAEKLRHLARIQVPRAAADLDGNALQALARGWALGVLASRRAQELGLELEPGVARSLYWQGIEDLARGALIQRLQGTLSEPTQEELRRRYRDAPRKAREPAAYDLSLLHFGSVEGDPKRLEQARDVARRVESGELSFEEAARRHSVHASAANGGHVGWVPRPQATGWGATAVRTLRTLSPGDVTPLLHLESGLWLFRVEGLRPARELSFEEVEESLRNTWMQEEAERRRDELVGALPDEIGLTVLPKIGPQADGEHAPGGVSDREVDPPVIRWSTASEFENLGYHVYRGDGPDGPFNQVTPELIPGAGTSDVRHDYRFEDVSAEPGTTYYYYVESISTSGERKQLTPVRAARRGVTKDDATEDATGEATGEATVDADDTDASN